MIHRALPRLAFMLSTLVPLAAQDEAPAAEPESFAAAIEQAGVPLIAGPATVRLGEVAEIQLPEGFKAVPADAVATFYELTRNAMNGREVGVIIAPPPGEWMLFFDYDPIGYVKDDEKDQLDADALMRNMTENQEAANAQRAERGWDAIKTAGWAIKPHYDSTTNNLKWAVSLTSSADNHTEEWINESVRLLGRSGVMNVTLVTDTSSFPVDTVAAGELLAGRFSYVEGQRYAEFRAGDKVAEYGLAALVLGGAGAVAYKLGFLQKFWKVLVAGGIAVAAGLGKLFNRITGKNPRT